MERVRDKGGKSYKREIEIEREECPHSWMEAAQLGAHNSECFIYYNKAHSILLLLSHMCQPQHVVEGDSGAGRANTSSFI